jgi:hypothetical protein
VATSLVAAAKTAGINVPLIVRHDSLHPESTPYAVSKLESGTVRVAIVLGNRDDFSVLASRKLFVLFSLSS